MIYRGGEIIRKLGLKIEKGIYYKGSFLNWISRVGENGLIK